MVVARGAVTMKKIVSTVALLGSVMLLACNSPEKAQKSADEARQTADEQQSKAQRVADQQKMQAEATAQQKQDQATLALTSAKNDYHSKITALLTEVDRTTADLRTANATAIASDKFKNNDKLTAIAARKSVLDADLKQVDTATAANWDTLKAQVDRDLDGVRLVLVPVGKT